MTDPIADMLTRIRNASTSGNTVVSIPFSKIKFAISEILVKEGWIHSTSRYGKKTKRHFEVMLPTKKIPAISGIKRISKLGKRIYRGWKELRPVHQGYGIAVISTPKGLLTDKEARKLKVGGEVLFEVW